MIYMRRICPFTKTRWRYWWLLSGFLLYFTLKGRETFQGSNDVSRSDRGHVKGTLHQNGSLGNTGNTSLSLGSETSSERTLVVLLTYQRSGSTFLAQIFNQDPRNFYAFEPLDGLYSAVYGTNMGYNSPSDIVQHWNGSKRTIPDFEMKSAAIVMDNLMTCQIDQLPTEIVHNVFWERFVSEHVRLKPYTDCLTPLKLHSDHCKNKIRSNCSIWFGDPKKKSEICRQNMWLDTSPNINPWHSRFASYKKCMDSVRKRGKKCEGVLTGLCEKAAISSVKVVRMSMLSVEQMLKTHEHSLKVIHLIRDPRAVAVSRMKFESVRGHSSKNSKTAEADIICRVLEEDVVIRRRLEKLYPRTFYQVIYEDFMTNPAKETLGIYKHIGISPSQAVLDYMAAKPASEVNTSLRNLTISEAHAIDKECETVYQLLGHPWAYNDKDKLNFDK